MGLFMKFFTVMGGGGHKRYSLNLVRKEMRQIVEVNKQHLEERIALVLAGSHRIQTESLGI
jgi:hypothetical protein